jgi:hypothetical protein
MSVASNQGNINGYVDVKDECAFFKRKFCHVKPAYEMNCLEITKCVKQQSEAISLSVKRDQLCLPLCTNNSVLTCGPTTNKQHTPTHVKANA